MCAYNNINQFFMQRQTTDLPRDLIFHIVGTWNVLKCLSFVIDCKDAKSLMSFMADVKLFLLYINYLPTAITGPLIIFNDFKNRQYVSFY